MSAAHPIAAVIVRSYGAALVASGVLKALAPYQAASLLSWTGLAPAHRVDLVDVASVAETAIGALLLLGVRSRFGWSAAALLGCLLVGLQVTVVGVGTGAPCGCFGPLQVPVPISLLTVAAGTTACLWLALRRPGAAAPVWRWRCAGVAAAVVAGLIALRPADAIAEARVALAEGTATSERPTLIVVGTTSCAHCREEISRMREARARASWRYGRVVLLTPIPEPAASFGIAELRSIGSRLWWQLVEDRPPAYYELSRGELVRRADWR